MKDSNRGKPGVCGFKVEYIAGFGYAVTDGDR